ncbi:MAG: Ribosomal large subunit pseudouridine synthase D [Chlamydiales bacterium]|nr:Ribosomal large subunit pseudouridine synthase D [Chlamydiales bacterium]MCH9635880.1 Ribosomal large subunit pseudouridine synthase D [Chlamydiales bacterium]MCH9704396.1 RluA family pseudouridine synthase [Chlamydiota bacterium]
MKLLEKLALDFPDSSKRTLLNWIRHGRILVNDKPCRKPHELVEEYSLKESKQEIFGIPILYRDKQIIVIDKPAGLLSVPANSSEPSALELLCRHFKTKNIFAVHRIDQDTSGILLFVWGQEAQARFDAMFAAHDLQREYIAIVDGKMQQQEGSWTFPLLELEDYSVVVHPKGRRCLSHYKVLRKGPSTSFLSLRLETGRKHQIRVHCKEAGHPIIGDRRYGRKSSRLFLHARLLSFVHPFTDKEMRFESKIPKPFIQRGFPL